MMAYFLVFLIVVISGAILFALLWDIKRNWKKPRVKWSRNKKLVLIGIIVLVVLKGIESFIIEKHKVEQERHNRIERHIHIMEQASNLITQSVDIKDCNNRVQTGEFKTNVAAYLCKKPYIIEIYRKAGVRHEDSLEAISNEFLEIATNNDKGKPFSSEDLFRYMLGVLRHDESEP